MVSKFQWKPFWLAFQVDQQNDWTGWQNGVNCDVFAQAQSSEIFNGCVPFHYGDVCRWAMLPLATRKLKTLGNIIGSAEALPILCVRYIRWERERDTEREREKDGSDVTIVALKLAMSFERLLAKNVHLSIDEEFCATPCQKFAPQFLPSWMALSSHFPLPKTLHISKQFAFFALSNGVIDRGSKQQSKRFNFRLHRSFSSKYRKNESN